MPEPLTVEAAEPRHREPGEAAHASARRRRRWLARLGGALGLASLGWVLWPIAREARELASGIDGRAAGAAVGFGALLYAIVSLLLAASWWRLAGLYGRRVEFRRGYSIWARSQLAKYAPGNALHLVSRQLLGRVDGYDHVSLAASSVLETASLLLAAAAVTATTYAVGQGLGAQAVVLPAAVLGLGAVLAWPLVDRLLRRSRRLAPLVADLPPIPVGRAAHILLPSTLLHLVFFLATGTLLFGLATVLAAGERQHAVAVIAAYPLAWAAGMVTLGAPAGVGVREAILTLQLGPLLGVAPAATLALALRLVTTFGDLLTALAGWGLRRSPVDPGG